MSVVAVIGDPAKRESLVIRTRQITQNSYLDFLRTILCSKHTSVAGNNIGAVNWFVKYAGLRGDASFSTANRKNPEMTVPISSWKMGWLVRVGREHRWAYYAKLCIISHSTRTRTRFYKIQ
jgi:hypothetical protein